MEPHVISYNDLTLFHMLRHFESINDAAMNCLLERRYRKTKILKEITIPGSKFHSHFANDLKSLEQSLLNGVIKDSFTRNGYLHQCLEFDATLFPKGIGSIGIASIAALKENGVSSFEWKQNRGLELCHAKLKSLPNTWLMTVVLKPQTRYHLLITAFPGIHSLPLPKKGNTDAFNKECQQFWQEHAFLELAK